MRGLVIILIILSVIAVGIFIFQMQNEKEERMPSAPRPVPATSIPTAYASPAPTPPVSPKLSPLVTKNIVVSSPVNNQSVSGSFTIIGEARVFENVVSIRVTDMTTGKVLTQTIVYASAPDVGQFGSFALRFDIPQGLQPGNKLLVEVYQTSPKDGSEIDKTAITVLVK